MSEPAQAQPQQKRGHPFRVAAAFTLAAAAAIGGYVAHDSGGVMLIESGRPEAGKKLIETIGSGQGALDAQLFAEVYANKPGDDGMIRFLLGHGAIPDGSAIGHAISNGRADILGQLLDKDSHLTRVYTESAINKDGTIEMLEVLRAHGARFEGRLLADAAKDAPPLLDWVYTHGSYIGRDMDNALAAATDAGNTDAYVYLRRLREPDGEGRGMIMRAAVRNPAMLPLLLETENFTEADRRAGLAGALEAGNETAFNLIKARLPESAVSEVVAEVTARQGRPVQFLIRQQPQTLTPGPR